MYKDQQTSTTAKTGSTVDVIPIPFEMLSLPQQSWVDYNVVQGVLVESDGTMTKLTVQQFADNFKVNRTTCYNWTKQIPNFWDLVAMRRKQIFSGARTAKVWNALFLTATTKLNPTAQAIWLANADDKFRMPNQTITHEAGGGILDVLEIARKRRIQNITTAEVIDATVSTSAEAQI